MQTIALHSFRDEFRKRAEWRRDDERRTVERARQEREKKREEAINDQNEAFIDYAMSVMASDVEIAAFTVKLDRYDVATVEALMENERELAEVRKELQGLLDKAYVMPDGRRVFKTEDGTRVFDEHGIEVKDFDPDQIENWRPYWQRYEGPFKKAFALQEMRDDIAKFEDLKAKVRDEVDEGGITKERMDELEALLVKNAPEPIKRRMGIETEAAHALTDKATPELGAEQPELGNTARLAAKLDMPTF